jgi:hypothetical protein
MNQQTSKRQKPSADQPERGPRAYRRWRGYVQGVQMGAFLFLLCHFPDVLLINLTPFAEAWLVIWLYFLFSGVLMVFWLLLAVKIGSRSRQDAPQAYALVTILLLWLVEQTAFFLLVK